MDNTINDSFDSIITAELLRSQSAIAALFESSVLRSNLADAARAIIASLNSGGRIFLAGNGGSAADAQHIAAEFVSRFKFDRPPLSAIALTTDTSILTAIGNDYSFIDLFTRQLQAHARTGDIFIGLTTSGRSPNVLSAFSLARSIGVCTIGLCGETGLAAGTTCDYLLACPSTITAKIQECHIVVAHILCDLVERTQFLKHS